MKTLAKTHFQFKRNIIFWLENQFVIDYITADVKNIVLYVCTFRNGCFLVLKCSVNSRTPLIQIIRIVLNLVFCKIEENKSFVFLLNNYITTQKTEKIQLFYLYLSYKWISLVFSVFFVHQLCSTCAVVLYKL